MIAERQQGTPISITRSNGLVTFNSAGAAGSASFVGLATFATLTATGVATFTGAVTFEGAATFSDLTASKKVTGANVIATGVLHSNSHADRGGRGDAQWWGVG